MKLALAALLVLGVLAPTAAASCVAGAVCASAEHEWMSRQICARVSVSFGGVAHHNVACTQDFTCPYPGHICWSSGAPLPGTGLLGDKAPEIAILRWP